ncbi:MAG TPA: hypothetical protein VFV72_16025 [Candidatus Limnocylindrales bacterium]|nr:hypothetical protein [Candidatus Limnocylindrales bacterium]
MSEPPAEAFDVPVGPVGRPGARSSRRAIAVLAAVVVAAGWLVAMAGAGRDAPPARQAAPEPSGAVVASSSDSPAPSRLESPASDLPVIANRALVGSPATVFVVRDGADARLITWRPGVTFLRELRRGFPDAFSDAGAAAGSIAWLAPDLASLVLSEPESPTQEGLDAVRLVTRDGVAWRADGVTALGGLVWSGLGDRFAIAGRRDRWLLAGRARDATWATAAEIDVSAGRQAGAAPSPTLGPVFALTDRIEPYAFSRSGEWVVGARFDPDDGTLAPAVRVRFSDGGVEPISAFPTEGSDGLGSGPTQLVDATTGRTVVFGPNASIPGGPPQLEVREADGSYAFGVRSALVVGWLWTGDGRLVVLGADGAPFPSRWTLQLIDRDGRSRALVEAPRASRGALLGIKDGHVGLLLTGADRARSQVIVVRLADGEASAITVPSIGEEGPIGNGWEP